MSACPTAQATSGPTIAMRSPIRKKQAGFRFSGPSSAATNYRTAPRGSGPVSFVSRGISQPRLSRASAGVFSSTVEDEDLFVLKPAGDGTCFHLNQQFERAGPISFPANEDSRLVIGRRGGGKAGLEIDLGSLSAAHAEFTVSRGRLYVTDLGSTNGTMVNGKYLRPGEETRLRPGQTLILGDEHLAAFKVSGPGEAGLFGAIAQALGPRLEQPAAQSTAAVTATQNPAKTPSPQAAGRAAGAAAVEPEALPGGGQLNAPHQAGTNAGQVAGTVAMANLARTPGPTQAAAASLSEAAAEEWQAESMPGSANAAPTVETHSLPEQQDSSIATVTPTTSSVAVRKSDAPRKGLAWQSEGEVAEKAGAFGALAEMSGKLGAMITNSQVQVEVTTLAAAAQNGFPMWLFSSGDTVMDTGRSLCRPHFTLSFPMQVNYQYKPVVQFNTGGKPMGPSEIKSTLLVAMAGKDLGRKASERDVAKIEQLTRSLEANNPTPKPLRSPLLNGRWALQYTTSKTMLKRGIFRPSGPIHQTVDIFNLQVLNEESYEPLPFLKWKNAATSNLSAKSESRAAVKPDQFRVGPFKVNAPPTSPARAALNWEAGAMGNNTSAWMDTTFLDADLRVSRDSNGDLFIFTRDDPNDDP
eukprot:CAMPEP_0117667468 /NCGR_PEP_ID=MMETSP0804-20121206/10987_1 /TAXON_ID=1074897 /ORGANISM="Tetraselmis astigmatica, Strain CCMP880" /LENGTH=638 /DNA_ID=CAMNT_0005475205 /DNA_START=259 /DNA_END=2176 /DNA_ORIENTATION=+